MSSIHLPSLTVDRHCMATSEPAVVHSSDTLYSQCMGWMEDPALALGPGLSHMDGSAILKIETWPRIEAHGKNVPLALWSSWLEIGVWSEKGPWVEHSKAHIAGFLWQYSSPFYEIGEIQPGLGVKKNKMGERGLLENAPFRRKTSKFLGWVGWVAWEKVGGEGVREKEGQGK